jgi:hypothetical protein
LALSRLVGRLDLDTIVTLPRAEARHSGASQSTTFRRKPNLDIPSQAKARHSGESRNPFCFSDDPTRSRWIPAFAGMTALEDPGIRGTKAGPAQFSSRHFGGSQSSSFRRKPESILLLNFPYRSRWIPAFAGMTALGDPGIRVNG